MMTKRNEIYAYIGSRLRHYRKQKSLKQHEIAEIIGMSAQQYQKYESGLNKCPMDTIIKLCNFYKVQLDAIVPVEIDSVDGGQVANVASGPLPAVKPKREELWGLKEAASKDHIVDEIARLLFAFSAVKDTEKRQVIIKIVESMA